MAGEGEREDSWCVGGVSGDEGERERSRYSVAGVLGKIGLRCSGVEEVFGAGGDWRKFSRGRKLGSGEVGVAGAWLSCSLFMLLVE